MRIIALTIFIFLITASAAANAAAPMRVVSLKPSVTDTIYALGLGERLVGVTKYCDVPPGEKRPEIVADYTRPYSERIISLSPQLVIGSRENSSQKSIEALENSGIKVALFPFTNMEETLGSIRGIAAELGDAARGDKLAKDIESQFVSIRARYGAMKPLRVIVVWGTRPIVAAGPGSYMDELMGYVGATNAVRTTKIKYPHLGLEELIALDPDVIVDLSMGSEQGKDLKRPWDGVNEISAVRNGRVITMDASLFRAGPRLPVGLKKLAELMHGTL